jgi:hypothetical protein
MWTMQGQASPRSSFFGVFALLASVRELCQNRSLETSEQGTGDVFGHSGADDFSHRGYSVKLLIAAESGEHQSRWTA